MLDWRRSLCCAWKGARSRRWSSQDNRKCQLDLVNIVSMAVMFQLHIVHVVIRFISSDAENICWAFDLFFLFICGRCTARHLTASCWHVAFGPAQPQNMLLDFHWAPFVFSVNESEQHSEKSNNQHAGQKQVGRHENIGMVPGVGRSETHEPCPGQILDQLFMFLITLVSITTRDVR